MLDRLKEVKLRVIFPLKGCGPTDKMCLSVTLWDLVEAGGLMMEHPEKYSGEEAALDALRDLRKTQAEETTND